MTEGVGTGERRLNQWLSKEEINRDRKAFIRDNCGQFLTFIQDDEHFSDLSPELKNMGADLITRFFFGVHMVYRRLGNKYPVYNLTYDIGERDEYDGIAFHDDTNKYVVKVSFLKKVLEIVKEKGRCDISGMGIKEMIPAVDFFEIAGVEEAAHLLFFNEKRHLGKGPVSSAKEEDRYYTSDMESRALIWKLAYVKRYMPQYQHSLRETAERVTKIRLESRADKAEFAHQADD